MSLFGKSWTLFKILGFPVKVNPTWFLLFFLIVFSLSSPGGLFSAWLEQDDVSASTLWLLGVIGALGLFSSLLIHELAHSIVARRTGMPVGGITLFIFGGVSEMEAEPPTASAEFFMAVVGPLSSLALSAFFLSTWALLRFVLESPPTVYYLFFYLAIVNFLLAAFNSLPAFPLDGGRILRSFLWGISENLYSATRIASFVGSAFGMLMMIIGVFSLFYGGGIGGIWLIFLGFFLRQAAISSAQNVKMQQTLGGETVGRFMTAPPVCVSQDISIDQFVHDFVLPYHFSIFPVINDEGKLAGIIHSLRPGEINRDRWPHTLVKDIMESGLSGNKISPDTSATEALSQLSKEQGQRLVVVENGYPVGIISLRDLMDFIQLKSNLKTS